MRWLRVILPVWVAGGALWAQPYAGGQGDGWASAVWEEPAGLSPQEVADQPWRVGWSSAAIWLQPAGGRLGGEVTVTVTTVTGRQLWQRRYPRSWGRVRIPWADWPAGVYLLSIVPREGRVRIHRLNRRR